MMNRENGSALIESVFVLPVLFLLFFGAIEFGRAFTSYNQILFIARVAAIEASRDCTTDEIWELVDGDPGPPFVPSDRTGLNNCVQRIVEETWMQAEGNLPDIRLILSIYRRNGPITREYIYAYRPTGVGGGEFYSADDTGHPTYDPKYATRFSRVLLTSNADYRAAITATDNLAIVEAYIPFSSNIKFMNSFFMGAFGSDQHVTAFY